jgi:hypothetical protein
MSLAINNSNLFHQMMEDTAIIKKDEPHQFETITIQQVQEFSAKKKLYKQFKTEGGQYQEYKTLLHKLRLSKLPFRIIELLKNNTISNEMSWNKSSKEDKSKACADFEAKMLKDCRSEILELASRINWLHGTNSSILAFMPYTDFTLISTGRLLEKGIAPMSGEISKGGLASHGINQTQLSTDTIGGISRCWDYAQRISHTFDPKEYKNAEKFFIGKLYELSDDDPLSWDATLIFLYRLKQWNPLEFELLCQKHADKISALKEGFKAHTCPQETLILKALDYDESKVKLARKNENIRQEIEKEWPCITKSWNIEWYDKQLWGNRYSFIGFKSALSLNWNLTREIIYYIFKLKTYTEEEIKEKNIKEKVQNHFCKLQEARALFENSDQNLDKAMDVLRSIAGKRIKNQTVPYNKVLKRFERLFFDKPSVHFSAEDIEHLQKPFPILVASTTSKSSRAHRLNEVNIPQAKLGQEIDLMFVCPENLQTMKQWTESHNLDKKVRILDINFLEEAKKIPLYPAPHQVTDTHDYLSTKDILKLNQDFQKHVIPLYQAPYPNGENRRWHGVPHACRVAIFSEIIGSIYQEAGFAESKTKGNLQIAAGLHDCARQNDGTDLWDKESGAKAKEILQDLGVAQEETDFFEKAVAEKDSKTPSSLEQRIIHDADCIEIKRCLHSDKDFKATELWIMKQLDTDLVNQFIAEATLWIQLTEKPEIKAFIEASENPYACFHQILNYVNRQYGKLELLSRHLVTGLSSFCGPGDYILTSEIEGHLSKYMESL